MDQLLEAAVASAHAGAIVLDARRADLGLIRSKSSATDLVSEADIAAGVAAASAIAERYEGARFVIEEEEVYELAGVARGSLDDERVWVIDPLDGTTSFVHGFPCFSVSVACVSNGQPIAGAVHNVALAEVHSAAAGLGSFLDGTPRSVSAAAEVSDALLVTGFPYDRGAPLDRQLAVLAAFLRNPVHGIRRDGSAAIDCCHVAVGRADGFWEYALKPWDMAAGALIAREAGATVTDVDGQPWTVGSTSICVANPTLQPKMLEVIRRAT